MKIEMIGALAPILVGVLSFTPSPVLAGRGEQTPRPYWTLTPEAKTLVEECREKAKAYRPMTDRTRMFSRAQLKYGAQRTDFIHNWYDRPLHQDSAWAETADPRQLLHPEAWKKTAETVRLSKLDGLAACITQTGRREIIDRSRDPGGEMPVLIELPYAYNDKGLESFLQTAEKALAMPNAFRLDGKVVLTRYPAVHEDGFPFCEKFRKALTEKFGPDKFIVMCYAFPFEERISGEPFTAANVTAAQEHLRRCLRAMDGMFLTGSPSLSRRYNPEFTNKVLAPIFQSVLAEPEFAGKKYFGLQIAGGHENCYRWSYSLDSEGTRQLCERLKSVALIRPDFIICTEWDEENENTFFRPTVANGFTTQRILRYFADRFAGRAPEVFPGDDVSIPNLVVSYRRSLIAGEPIEAEVRNIPDGTFAGDTFDIQLRWLDGAGRPVKTYPPQRLRADELEAVRFVSPSSELVAENRFLVPDLAVRDGKGGKFRFGSDFWPLDLNVARALDTKWAKHALRERAKGVTGNLTVGPKTADGTRTVTGSFSSAVPVRSVEVLEGPDTIYMYDPATAAATDDVTVKLEVQARAATPSKYAINGTIRYIGAPGVRIAAEDMRGVKAMSDGWELKKLNYNNWSRTFFATVPAAEVATAEIAVDLAPNFKTVLKVKDIVEKDVIGVTGIAGGNLVASRFLSTDRIPKPSFAKDGTFSFRMKPGDRAALLRLQVVNSDYHVWRGAATSLFEPSGEVRKLHVFERDEGRIAELTVDRNLVAEPTYDFGDGRGAVVWTDEGLDYCGILGGAATLVTGYGRGESCYGDTITRYLSGKLPGEELNAPICVREPDGRTALEFRDCRYAMLPLQLVPKFAGFEVAVDVKPDTLEGLLAILNAGNAAWGLQLRDGVPEAFLFSTEGYIGGRGAEVVARGPVLRAGVWNRLKVDFDQSRLVVSVDGVEGNPVAYSGYQMQTRYTAVGVANRNPQSFFRGRISNLSFKVR